MPVRFLVSPPARPWLPDAATRQCISAAVGPDTTVRLLHRSQVEHDWARRFQGKPFPGRYAYRAYARGRCITVFVDQTETPESILWLLLHELTHAEVSATRLLRDGLRSYPRHPDYLTSDAAHDDHPEERLADLVADQWAPRLGGHARLNRPWWRQRVLQLGTR